MWKVISSLLLSVALLAPGAARSQTPLDELNRAARLRVDAAPRTPLAESLPGEIASLEPAGSGRTPNYLLAFAAVPDAAAPFSRLIKSVLEDGALEPELKMAMGLRIAQAYGSPYVAAHMQRFLRARPSGRELLTAIENHTMESLSPQRLAGLRYAEGLTRGVLGVSDEQFRSTRAHFSDSQVVELTLTVCFFNYFTRFAEGLHLPLERWALETEWAAPPSTYVAPPARVRLISDGEMEWSAQQAARDGRLPNSMRAMMQSPEIASAWRGYWGSTRQGAEADRELLLHVSFAVSMANGCRYCTLHQVQGLRRLGVNPTKLMQMKKDDSVLSPRELAAVVFARKLTADPMSVTDADFNALKSGLGGERGAFDVLLQTCSFAFMNRFTDGLRLPSEDEAIRIYRETYGEDFQRVAQR